MIYTDHEALKPIFATGQTEKGRIATWLDRLGEFDMHLFHRPSRDQHIGLADGLSRMPTRSTSASNQLKQDSRTLAFAINHFPGTNVPRHLVPGCDEEDVLLPSFIQRAGQTLQISASTRSPQGTEESFWTMLAEGLDTYKPYLTDKAFGQPPGCRLHHLLTPAFAFSLPL